MFEDVTLHKKSLNCNKCKKQYQFLFWPKKTLVQLSESGDNKYKSITD